MDETHGLALHDLATGDRRRVTSVPAGSKAVADRRFGLSRPWTKHNHEIALIRIADGTDRPVMGRAGPHRPGDLVLLDPHRKVHIVGGPATVHDEPGRDGLASRRV